MAPLTVSIITPSLNQARFLGETLRSVAEQDYPHIEHIVIDGGSTDGTLQILEAWSGRWISETDRGQADAIAKGLRLSTGDIVGWLNSDDVYLNRSAISKVVARFEGGAQVVTGGGRYIDRDGRLGRSFPVRPSRLTPDRIAVADYVLQPATFWTRELAHRFPIDIGLHYGFDWDLFIRLRRAVPFEPLPDEIAGYRVHPDAKTVGHGTRRQKELLRIVERYHGRSSLLYLRTAPIVAGWAAADRLPPPVRRPVQTMLWMWPRVLNWITDGRGGPG